MLGDDAAKYISNASGRIRIDHAHGAVGEIFLRRSRAGQRQRNQPRTNGCCKASNLPRALPCSFSLRPEGGDASDW
jgi:hypothetical protein